MSDIKEWYTLLCCIEEHHIQIRKLTFIIDATPFVLKMRSYLWIFCFLKLSRHVLSGVSGIVFAYITDKIVPVVFLSWLVRPNFQNSRSNTQFDQIFVKPVCFDQYSGDSDWRETDNAVCERTLFNFF